MPNPEPEENLRERAAECDRLAAAARTAEGREVFLYLANRWRALADEQELATNEKAKANGAFQPTPPK